MIKNIHIDYEEGTHEPEMYTITFILDNGQEYETQVLDSRISFGAIALSDKGFKRELHLDLVIASGMIMLGLELEL